MRNLWCSGEMLRYHEEPDCEGSVPDATDAEARKCGYRTGLDTLVVRTVNDGCPLLATNSQRPSESVKHPTWEYAGNGETQRN